MTDLHFLASILFLLLLMLFVIYCVVGAWRSINHAAEKAVRRFPRRHSQ